MSFSDYMETKILSWIKGTAFGTAPSSVYVALFNGNPLDTGAGGDEVTTDIRVAGRVAATFGTVGDGTMSNSSAVDFGLAAGNATVDYFGLYDAASGGNLLLSDPLNVAQTVVTGNAVSFAVGALTVNVS